MSSREKILAAVQKSQPEATALPGLDQLGPVENDPLEKFISVLTGIGGKVIMLGSMEELPAKISEQYPEKGRIVSPLPVLQAVAENVDGDTAPHELADVSVAVLPAHFGVAENSAVWITEALTGHRVLPFICQHLAVTVNRKDIINTMHEAYERIGGGEYGFGTFIAGPSKTADIEQSLVLGAHGPKSMTVFLYG